MNIESMIRTDNRFHVYAGCYIDLIMGCGISLSYIQLGDKVRIDAHFIESATINLLDLSALKVGMSVVSDKAPYSVYTNNRYLKLVLQNIGTWRRQNKLEERAYPGLLKEILEYIDKAGDGLIVHFAYKSGRDDMMLHLHKYAAHLYHSAQMLMIENQTTALPSEIIPSKIWNIKELPGEILWKTPFSTGEFQKRMAKSRLKRNPAFAGPVDKITVTETAYPHLKLVKTE